MPRIEGENVTIERIADLPKFAIALAQFLADLQLSAVIDFECHGVGDPACDLTIA
jgi:hypothetical protein